MKTKTSIEAGGSELRGRMIRSLRRGAGDDSAGTAKPSSTVEADGAGSLRSRPSRVRSKVGAREVVKEVLTTLRSELAVVVPQRMMAEFGESWRDRALGAVAANPAYRHLRKENIEQDLAVLLQIASRFWDELFRRFTPRGTKNYLEEARELRNDFHHGASFATSGAFRAADTVYRLLESLKVANTAEILAIRDSLLIQWSDELSGMAEVRPDRP